MHPDARHGFFASCSVGLKGVVGMHLLDHEGFLQIVMQLVFPVRSGGLRGGAGRIGSGLDACGLLGAGAGGQQARYERN